MKVGIFFFFSRVEECCILFYSLRCFSVSVSVCVAAPAELSLPEPADTQLNPYSYRSAHQLDFISLTFDLKAYGLIYVFSA